MKHISFADKSILVGDDAADTLLQYAAVVANQSRADTVVLNAISPDGNAVSITFLLDSGTVLAAESTNSDLNAPENSAAIEYMNAEMERLTATATPITASSEEQSEMEQSWRETY